MSQPAVAALAPLPFELVLGDREPWETDWHTLAISFLQDLIRLRMEEHGRTHFFVGTNLFVYYSVEQAREVAEEVRSGGEPRAFRGPDLFWVAGVDPDRKRRAWIAWEEGRLPDVIVEILSPKMAKTDRTEKKDLYAQVFGTAEYFLYDPEIRKLEGFRLAGQSYQPIPPDESGRLWSEQWGVTLGTWAGVVGGRMDEWVRLFHYDGSLVPTQAEAEQQRAEAAAAEMNDLLISLPYLGQS